MSANDGFPKLAFTSAQNEVLLAIGQYAHAFSHLDMAITFALADRIAGNMEASLIVLRNMDFRTRYERCFQICSEISPVSSQVIAAFRAKIESENKFRNVVLHSTIGVDPDGKAFLNSWGKGFGQASQVATHTTLKDIQDNVQRCWRLFLAFGAIFSPTRQAGFVAAMERAPATS